MISGKLSGISRTDCIYVPRSISQARWASYRFPAIELLHGSPGHPEQWVDPLNVLPTLDDMIAAGKADPVVLVLPDTDGGRQYSLQCVNAPLILIRGASHDAKAGRGGRAPAVQRDDPATGRSGRAARRRPGRP